MLEGTSDKTIDEATRWKPYEFLCKPGDLRRRPCVISPYQPRLDWQIWFAAMATPKGAPWVVHLVWKLLHNDRGALSLLANIRSLRRRRAMCEPATSVTNSRHRGVPEALGGSVLYVDDWLYPLSIGDPRLERFLSDYGWLSSSTKAEPRAAPADEE